MTTTDTLEILRGAGVPCEETRMKYNEYTVAISTEPHHYGSVCTQAGADRIAGTISAMVIDRFHGIHVETYDNFINENGQVFAFGPVGPTLDEINAWIKANWRSAI